MALSAEQKVQIIKKHDNSLKNTGAVEVQVSILTEDINLITEHVKRNKKDYHSRRGLLNKVNNRRSLLDYLKNRDLNRYRAIIKSLGLRR